MHKMLSAHFGIVPLLLLWKEDVNTIPIFINIMCYNPKVIIVTNQRPVVFT